MENIDINMIVEFIFNIFLIVFMTIILPKIKRHLDNEIGEEESEKLINLIYELVRASEQLLYDEDPDGSARKNYVIDKLKTLGYEWDEKLEAYVESAVYDLNREAHGEIPRRSAL